MRLYVEVKTRLIAGIHLAMDTGGKSKTARGFCRQQGVNAFPGFWQKICMNLLVQLYISPGKV